MTWLSIAEILQHVQAGAPGLPRTRKTIAQYLTSAESRPRYERGGGLEYALASLPAVFQRYLAPSAVTFSLVADASPQRIEPSDHAAAVDAVLAAFGEYWEASGLTRTTAVHEFCRAVGQGTIQLGSSIATTIRTLSTSKLWAWLAGKRRFGRFGSRNRRCLIEKDLELESFCLGLIAHLGQSAATIHRKLIQHFPQKSVCVKSVERWIKKLNAQNPAVFAGVTDPIRYRNGFIPAAGNLSQGITHANQRWEIDGTKSNNFSIQGAEGKDERYTLLVAVDVYSRRAITVIAKSESAASIIELLLRRCLITWGIPESIAVDNGKGFVSNRMRSTCVSLGIKLDILPPATPERKPHVERFHGTLDTMFLSTLPGYVGNNVATRRVLEAKAGKNGIQGTMTAAEIGQAIDNWVATYYEPVHQHRGLNGKTVLEQWASSPIPTRKLDNLRALDLLLAPIGRRNPTVSRQGIKYDNLLYTDANGEWVRQIGKQVSLRLDKLDPSRVYCFDPNTNEFLFIAIAPENLAEHAAIAKAKHKEVNKVINNIKKIGRQVAAVIGLDHLVDRTESTVVPFARTSKVDAPTAVIEALYQLDQLQTPAVPAERTAQQQALADTLAAKPDGEPLDRVERYRDLCDALRDGSDLSAVDWDWLDNHERQYGNTIRRIVSPESFKKQKTG